MVSSNQPTYNVWNSLSHAKRDSLNLHFLSSGIDEVTGELILKFVNGNDVPHIVSFELKETSKVEKIGKVITLSATNRKDENTFDEPQKIYPIESSFSKFGKIFTYKFAPLSYTILRIRVKN